MTDPQKPTDRLAPHPVLDRYYHDESERPREVRKMFDTGASDYDRIEKIMSFGTGVGYRKRVLQEAGIAQGMNVLDVATGTGVVARAARDLVGPSGSVAALDPSFGMLREAAKNGTPRVVQGMGEALPFPDNSFDFLSMGYALRHVSDLKTVFAEYFRVLKPGARVAIFEISRPRSKASNFFIGIYMGRIVPVIARVVSDRETSRLWRYYWETIKACVPPDTILAALRDAGFADVKRTVELGIFSSYLGVKR